MLIELQKLLRVYIIVMCLLQVNSFQYRFPITQSSWRALNRLNSDTVSEYSVGEDVLGVKLNLQKLDIPIRMKGIISHGYGRGSKKLGFPTANLPITSEYLAELKDVKPGVYAGYAFVENPTDLTKKEDFFNTWFKSAVNVGYSPTFEGKENPEKTVEAYLIRPASIQTTLRDKDMKADVKYFQNDFYGHNLKLILVGYLRPEAKFSTLPSLVTKIKEDVADIDMQLDYSKFTSMKDADPWFQEEKQNTPPLS